MRRYLAFPVALILLDLDGTLADPGEGIASCIAHAIRTLGGIPPRLGALRHCIGPPLEDTLPDLLPDPTPERVRQAIAIYRDRFSAEGHLAACSYPGIEPLLEALRRHGWRAMLVTFKPTDHALPIVERLGLRGALDDVIGSDPTRQESKRELVAEALRRAGTPGEDAVMVGDRHHDMEGAHGNGVAALGVSWGYGSRSELEAAGADWICDTPHEVLARLEAWFGNRLPVPRRELLALRRVPRGRPGDIEAPGPGQVSCWDFPRPPQLLAEPLGLRVEHAGRTLAHSRRGWQVRETASPPAYYLPPEDVTLDALEPWGGTPLCEWKGRARYWRLRGEGDPVAWSYPDPLPGYEALRNHLAFFASRVDACYVGDERASPQPGAYYGGWITRNITGPYKGAPGSEHW